jgi:small subunit ribosomal protein S5
MAEKAEKKDATTPSFVDTVVSVNRVTKVTKGGKRFSFSAFVVSGDQKGRVGIGLGKSREVSSAIAKATAQARKNLIEIALRGTTIAYPVTGKHGATSVVIRSASKGTGMIAGGAMRAVFQAVGLSDILGKTIGSSRCGQNVVKATLNALAKCRSAEHLAKLRGKTITELAKGDQHVKAA